MLLGVYQTCMDGISDIVMYCVALMTPQCFSILRRAASDCDAAREGTLSCIPVEVTGCPLYHAKLPQFPDEEKVQVLVCSAYQ